MEEMLSFSMRRRRTFPSGKPSGSPRFFSISPKIPFLGNPFFIRPLLPVSIKRKRPHCCGLCGQYLSSLRSSCCQYLSSSRSTHSGSEAVDFISLPVLRLECHLHETAPPSLQNTCKICTTQLRVGKYHSDYIGRNPFSQAEKPIFTKKKNAEKSGKKSLFSLIQHIVIYFSTLLQHLAPQKTSTF